MSAPDVFTGDVFSLRALTASINAPVEGQAVTGVADDLFNEEGISETKIYIEMQDGALSLVPAKAYGAPGDPTKIGRRNAKSFDLIHLVTGGAVLAHEVQGVRAFGSEGESEAVQAKVDAVNAKMRRRLEATIRYHRLKGLQGKIYDADGTTVLLNLFTEFDVTQQTKAVALSAAATKVKQLIEEAKEMSEDALGDSSSIVGYRMLCGRGWFNAFVSHEKIEAAYDRWDSGAFLRGSQAKQPFTAFDVEFHKVYGKVGGKEFIPTNEAYLVPILDDPDAYITRFGPADYMDTVNTMGLPFYSSSDVLAHNKGVSLEAQSNVLSIPTRPRSIIKMTKS